MLQALQNELKSKGFDAFFIPRGDEHMGEYVAPCSDRLRFITGFSGSAGIALVTQNRSAIFVDGRYTLQVQKECDPKLYDFKDLSSTDIIAWIKANLAPASKVAFDPWLHTNNEIEVYRAALPNYTFVSATENLVDIVWGEKRPAPPADPVTAYPIEYAGMSSGDKMAALAKIIAQKGCDWAVLTLTDSIAWALNIRGNDIKGTPVPLSFAMISKDEECLWFIDPKKVDLSVKQKNLSSLVPYPKQQFIEQLSKKVSSKTAFLLDKATVPAIVEEAIKAKGGRVVLESDPTLMLKAQKNEVEISGMKSAHIKDGAALVQFFKWLEETLAKGTEKVTELSAQLKLLTFRRKDPLFRGVSFNTICGVGANGAIVHYSSNEATNKNLQNDLNTLCLIDSGAQYLDGTTDITRTIALGTPSKEHQERYTLVLKGHLALGKTLFPEGTTGSQLDVLARWPLWQRGLDYNHGTGHGVGHFLSVHEGPQRIGKAPNPVALKQGMVLSNEPGFYKEGEYGIRIENLVVVTDKGASSGVKMLGFDNLTFFPYERSLIDLSLLTQEEISQINRYHQEVKEKLTPLLDPAASAWLDKKCAPLAT